MLSSYDEDDEYESNIDILESQIDDCMSSMVNEWWKAIKKNDIEIIKNTNWLGKLRNTTTRVFFWKKTTKEKSKKGSFLYILEAHLIEIMLCSV